MHLATLIQVDVKPNFLKELLSNLASTRLLKARVKNAFACTYLRGEVPVITWTNTSDSLVETMQCSGNQPRPSLLSEAVPRRLRSISPRTSVLQRA